VLSPSGSCRGRIRSPCRPSANRRTLHCSSLCLFELRVALRVTAVRSSWTYIKRRVGNQE
jgi:hypothetical protein